MIVEISGIGFPNKGAELMLCAASEYVSANWPNVITITTPTPGAPMGYYTLGAGGSMQKASLKWKGIDWAMLIANQLPTKVLRTYGVVAEKEVDVVLDSSGLRYSEKWGGGPLAEALKEYKRIKRRGGKIILMPQAFGPFESKKMKVGIKKLHDIVDLVYARDQVSYGFLTEIIGHSKKLRIAPDFTGLVSGRPPNDIDDYRGKVGIVPNQRMLDKTERSISIRYIDMLVHVGKCIQHAGIEVFILNHEGGPDAELCKQLSEKFHPNLSCTGVRDAKEIKAIIASASGLVTSRFHGLVSGLMQGVPVMATSWNHKYEEFMKRFNAQKFLLNSGGGESEWKALTNEWIEQALPSNSILRENYRRESAKVCNEIRSLWEEIEEVVF